jgi:CheY-like chemotaxis protein
MRTEGDPPCIMLVDDDLWRRYVMAELLRAEGYRVESASGHDSWLALFRTCLSGPATWVSFVAAVEPDLVVMEIAVGDGTALHTLGALRRHPLTQQIPVVVLGDEASQKELDAAITLGAACYLLRPLARNGLRPVVDEVLAQLPERRARTGDEQLERWLC